MYTAAFFHNHDPPKTGNNTNIPQLVNGQTVVHPYNRILLSNKKQKSSIDTYTTCMNLKCIVLSERRQIQRLHVV